MKTTNRKASEFWKKYHKRDRYRLHICNVPAEVFYARHAHALKLIQKYKQFLNEGRHHLAEQWVGLLIAGKYYGNVWNSRSCSGYLAQLVGIPDDNCGAYINFYCSSSDYFTLKTQTDLRKRYIKPVKQLVNDFKAADALDNRMA